MLFSICIPNYNYERYLGGTIESVLRQSYGEFEILIADNASTDRSVDVVRGFDDPRIRLQVNRCNVGFAGNLDRTARMARGDYMIMLSSDDLMHAGTLATYHEYLSALGAEAEQCVLSATVDVIDANGQQSGRIGPDNELWHGADLLAGAAQQQRGAVYRVDGRTLLKRCLLSLRNPFNFAATVYPRGLYEQVEGYGAGRLINPDKWFHWKLLGVCGSAHFIDRPLFSYRWHAENQTALQGRSRGLKYLVDQYASVMEFDDQVLASLGLTKRDLEIAFVERDIARHGLATLASRGWLEACRVRQFGCAAYPAVARRNWKVCCLTALLALGPVGRLVARALYRPRADIGYRNSA